MTSEMNTCETTVNGSPQPEVAVHGAAKASWVPSRNDLMKGVAGVISSRLNRVVSLPGGQACAAQFMPGKMLRTRLAARLLDNRAAAIDHHTAALLCAATELAHTASLCHDDVIDGAVLRRGYPPVWRITGPSAAVLIGDVLLCEAMDLLLDANSSRFNRLFVDKVREVCAAEAEQELLLRGEPMDEPTCLRLARSKTGPLFAFVACACGGDNLPLAAALEEAGYRIGAAYQLADDLLDVIGDERTAAKTLGTDSRRGKFTLPVIHRGELTGVRTRALALCLSSLDCLESWPDARHALAEYLLQDMQPVFDQYSLSLDVRGRLEA